MKKFYRHFRFLMLFLYCTPTIAQSLVFASSSNPYNCFPYSVCSQPQPNYDAGANKVTGKIYLLNRDFYSAGGIYKDKLIKFDSLGNRLLESVLPDASYGLIAVDHVNSVFVMCVRNDSVIVSRYNQGNLVLNWSNGFAGGAGTPEAFDIVQAWGYVFFGFNDSAGLHIYKLNKTTGAIVSNITYNTCFLSFEHGLDIEVSSQAVFVAGYVSRPGTVYGDELWLAKFNADLVFRWQKLYDKNLGLTNNSDRASHVRIYMDTLYVCGTVTTNSGNIDAMLIKYTHNGTELWQKKIHKGLNDHSVDCSIDRSNGDVYLLQNAFTTLHKIFVTRFNSSGAFQWSKGYASTDTTGQGTYGNNIYADANPDGSGCEVYVTGQREDYGGDPHGWIYGSNDLAFKYNRTGTRTVFYAPDTWSGNGGLAPRVSVKKSLYYPDYLGRPNLFLLSDGDIANGYIGIFEWRLFSYNINSTARLSDQSQSAADVLNYNLQIYPNPASDIITLDADETMEKIRLLNLTGQEVKKFDGKAGERTFSVAELPRGWYFAEVTIQSNLIYSRFIIQ